jgi:hypothetical protein
MVANPTTAHNNYPTDMREIKELAMSGGEENRQFALAERSALTNVGSRYFQKC